MSALRREVPQVCKNCGSKMTPLFYTLECERCDQPATGWFYVGYILWTLQHDELWESQEHPIFRCRGDCENWRDRQHKPSRFEVRYCLSYDKFYWDRIPGTDLEMSTIYHKVKHTHKFDRNQWAVILLPRYATLPPHNGQLYVDKTMAAELGLDK